MTAEKRLADAEYAQLKQDLLMDVAGCAMRYVDTLGIAEFHDLERAAKAWKKFYWGEES